MKKYFSATSIVAVFIFLGCSKQGYEDLIVNESLPVTNSAIIGSANGQGTLELPFYDGRAQHFSFHVRKYSNGQVDGSWESKSPGQDIRTHGKLNCITFLDDNTAFVTGVVTHKSGQGFPGQYEVGMPIWFKIRDNGEGNNNNADEFTDYYSLEGIECINYEQASMHPINSGNIQIRQ